MANEVGLEVVAEGVEYVEELLALKEMGCHRYQGFIASAPIPGSEFAAILANERSLRIDAEDSIFGLVGR
jgi:EAL domain-containing protein (putative c-di-GMP-specific phosphodiesterase class I)